MVEETSPVYNWIVNMNEEREEQHTPADDAQDAETRRDFLKKLSYVAPLMITFQMDEEALAKDDDDDDGGKKKKKKVSPAPKTKKSSKKKSSDDDDDD